MKLPTRLLLFGILLLVLLSLLPEVAGAQNGAERLRQAHASLQADLEKNAFGRPLHLESKEASRRVEGDVHARLDQSFETVKSALSQPENWCEVFILHINTKYCRASRQNGRAEVVLKIGKKDFQELSAAHTVRFTFQASAAGKDFFEARMLAPEGPLGTTDYRVQLSAIPLPGNKSFIELRYSYAYGRLGSMAMDGYLSTVGRNKVGFTRVGQEADGTPQFVKGYRGVVERNAMRYYLAIDAFLWSLSQPENGRREQALARWFDSTEQYATQLHETDRNAYVQMKRREIARARETAPENLD